MKKTLSIDYVSDLHLGFYLPYDKNVEFKKEDIRRLIKREIVPKKQGEIIAIAGDVCENITCTIDFLNILGDYYDKVFFVAGNHEYYLMEATAEKYQRNSLNKIKELYDGLKDSNKVVFLDVLCKDDNGQSFVYNYKGFTITGDTLWYIPKGLEGRDFFINSSNDSRLIQTPSYSAWEVIDSLYLNSMRYYDELPKVDLMITHVPPVHNPDSRYGPNSCYYSEVKELKADTWIYGHDHEVGDFVKAGTRFLSNPWGYYSALFPLKNIVISKAVDDE